MSSASQLINQLGNVGPFWPFTLTGKWQWWCPPTVSYPGHSVLNSSLIHKCLDHLSKSDAGPQHFVEPAAQWGAASRSPPLLGPSPRCHHSPDQPLGIVVCDLILPCYQGKELGPPREVHLFHQPWLKLFKPCFHLPWVCCGALADRCLHNHHV